jgi:hypothetical protein
VTRPAAQIVARCTLNFSPMPLALQANHRQALADAAGRLRELEGRRVAALKDVVATFLSSYP